MTSKAQEHEKKQIIWISKDTRSKVKRQSTEWEKVFTNYISHKGLVSRIYKECLQYNNKKSNLNLGKRFEQLP